MMNEQSQWMAQARRRPLAPEQKQEAVTKLLVQAADGEIAAAGELLPLVYDELRSLAAAYFKNERANHTLQPTALVHEAYMRLVDQSNIQWKSRNQFFFLAAKAMRNILVDHARGKNRLKRGGSGDDGWRKITMAHADALQADASGNELDPADLLAIDEALEQLGELDERKARLVELRFFAGLTSEDAARILGIARSTAAEEWRMARAWLQGRLKDGVA